MPKAKYVCGARLEAGSSNVVCMKRLRDSSLDAHRVTNLAQSMQKHSPTEAEASMICLEGECCFLLLHGHRTDLISSAASGNIETETGKVRTEKSTVSALIPTSKVEGLLLQLW